MDLNLKVIIKKFQIEFDILYIREKLVNTVKKYAKNIIKMYSRPKMTKSNSSYKKIDLLTS